MTEPPEISAAAELRDLFAATLHAADCTCRDYRTGTAWDDSDYYRRLAAAEVDLFDLVELQRTERGHCYVARTNPTEE